ncbi:MAG: nucleoside hydrolase [Acetobacteraceae bacterium]
MTRKIIIDTDPGQDDAVAILLALAAHDALEVLAVVTVAGNVPLERTMANARKILELAERIDVPLYAGCRRPLRRAPVTAEHVHGPSGLDGYDFPAPSMPVKPLHGVDYLIDVLTREPPGTVTLCTLGPLTNVAMALVKAPEIAGRIKEIVMMAGAQFEVGNITPAAEFNFYADPEAADTVLSSGAPIAMLSLDVSHQVLSTRARLGRIEALGNRAGKAVAGMLSFSERFDRQKYGWDGAPLHDPCVIAWLLAPDLFGGRTINVRVETGSPLTYGATVADWWQITDVPRNVHYLREVDAVGFYDLLTELLARLP